MDECYKRRMPPRQVLLAVLALVAPAAALLPPCGNTADSCTLAEPGAVTHLWGLDGGESQPWNAVHNATAGDPMFPPGAAVRLGAKLPLAWLRPHCPTCPEHLVVTMDEDPVALASRHAAQLPNAVEGAFEAMFADAALLQYMAAVRQLQLHMGASGVQMRGVEGSTSAFLGKLRLMRKLALEYGTGATVCEVGFNAGHSALLWLTAGARRVLSFELGQYPYSGVAVGWLAARFPGRLQVIHLQKCVPNINSGHKVYPPFPAKQIFI
jgi:hypothetical protein